MDYEVERWEMGDLIKLDILVNGDVVDALSTICHREQSFYKEHCLQKLKDFIPRQMFEVAVQASDSRQSYCQNHSSCHAQRCNSQMLWW